jgi:DNA-binding IclR family transcriptional regulator
VAASALAANRALAVLNYFTANPNRAFTLSELSSALSVSMASLSAVLRSLTDAGYLVRHPRHKTYQLGPSLIAVGNAASAQHPVVELARPEMRALAAETGCECVGSTVVGDEILLIALEGRPSPRTPQLILGQRLPFLPPLGEVFVAWSSDRDIERWIGKLGANVKAAPRKHLDQALAHVRRRGYSVNLVKDDVQRLAREMAQHPGKESARKDLIALIASLGDDYELLDTDPNKEYAAAIIAVPVFGIDGSVVFALTLSAVVGLTGRTLAGTAEKLMGVGLHLTRQIGGRVPDAFTANAGR